MNDRPSDFAMNQIREALLQGNKINAVKIYKESTGKGLAESKGAIDQIEIELGISCGTPKFEGTPKRGCFATAMLCCCGIIPINIILVFLLPKSISAHETWLLPTKFAVKQNEEVRLLATSGMEFPKREASIDTSRIAKASCRLAAKQSALTKFEKLETALALTDNFPDSGVATIWTEFKPRDIELTDEQVAEYFDEIAAAEAIRNQWDEQRGRAPWKETYTKHAKTFISVGDPKSDRSWESPVGMRLEFVPLDNPLAASSGDTFRVKVLLEGKPLANLPIGLIVKDNDGRQFAESNAEGVAELSLPKSGEAMFFTVYLRQNEDGSGQWQSDFTTLTILIR